MPFVCFFSLSLSLFHCIAHTYFCLCSRSLLNSAFFLCASFLHRVMNHLLLNFYCSKLIQIYLWKDWKDFFFLCMVEWWWWPQRYKWHGTWNILFLLTFMTCTAPLSFILVLLIRFFNRFDWDTCQKMVHHLTLWVFEWFSSNIVS